MISQEIGHYHDWPVDELWGVIIGLAKCKRCGVVSTNENINEFSPLSDASKQTVQADALGHADGCAWNHHEVVNGKSYCKRCKHRLT